jgi:hypothetical protein
VAASNVATLTSNQAFSNVFWTPNAYAQLQTFTGAMAFQSTEAPLAASNSTQSVLYLDVADSVLRAKNSNGQITTFNPCAATGDLAVHSGTTTVCLPVGTAGQFLGVGTFPTTGGVGWTDFVWGTQYQESENNNSNITSSTATLRDRLVLTTHVIPAGSYRITACYNLKVTNAGRVGRVMCYVDNSNAGIGSGIFSDSLHYVANANSVMETGSMFTVDALTEGQHSVVMAFSCPAANTTLSLPAARLELFRAM